MLLVEKKRIWALLRKERLFSSRNFECYRDTQKICAKCYLWPRWSEWLSRDVSDEEMKVMRDRFKAVESKLINVSRDGLEDDDQSIIVVAWGKGGFATAGVYRSWKEAKKYCHNVQYANYWKVLTLADGWAVMDAIYKGVKSFNACRELLYVHAPSILTNLDVHYAPLVLRYPPPSIMARYKLVRSSAFTWLHSGDEDLAASRELKTELGRLRKGSDFMYFVHDYAVEARTVDDVVTYRQNITPPRKKDPPESVPEWRRLFEDEIRRRWSGELNPCRTALSPAFQVPEAPDVTDHEDQVNVEVNVGATIDAGMVVESTNNVNVEKGTDDDKKCHTAPKEAREISEAALDLTEHEEKVIAEEEVESKSDQRSQRQSECVFSDHRDQEKLNVESAQYESDNPNQDYCHSDFAELLQARAVASLQNEDESLDPVVVVARMRVGARVSAVVTTKNSETQYCPSECPLIDNEAPEDSSGDLETSHAPDSSQKSAFHIEETSVDGEDASKEPAPRQKSKMRRLIKTTKQESDSDSSNEFEGEIGKQTKRIIESDDEDEDTEPKEGRKQVLKIASDSTEAEEALSESDSGMSISKLKRKIEDGNENIVTPHKPEVTGMNSYDSSAKRRLKM